MEFGSLRKGIIVAGIFVAVWLVVRYCLSVFMPFLMGTAIAFAAEPAVKFGTKKIHLPRTAAAGLGVGAMLILLVGLLSLAGALAVRELGNLAGLLPDMQQTAKEGILLLEDTLVGLTNRLPEGVRPLATGAVLEMFDERDILLGRLGRKVPDVLGALVGWIPDGALGIGTGLIAGFMISARLPRIRQYLQDRMPPVWYDRYLPALRSVRSALGGWLKAQGKLTLVTFGVLSIGFLLLRIPNGVWWAVPVALVDAVPMLGTGIVLVPWALVAFFRGRTMLGLGLLLLCAVVMILRRILEPKWLGRHLDLDPLWTLVLLYMGYRCWGVWGMILAPLVAAAVKILVMAQSGEMPETGQL